MQAAQAVEESVRTMHALVYHDPGKRALEQKPRPVLRDATSLLPTLKSLSKQP